MCDLCVYQMNPVQDADPQIHEGFREIDHLLSLRRDGEAGHRQVSFLWGEVTCYIHHASFQANDLANRFPATLIVSTNLHAHCSSCSEGTCEHAFDPNKDGRHTSHFLPLYVHESITS